MVLKLLLVLIAVVGITMSAYTYFNPNDIFPQTLFLILPVILLLLLMT